MQKTDLMKTLKHLFLPSGKVMQINPKQGI